MIYCSIGREEKISILLPLLILLIHIVTEMAETVCGSWGPSRRGRMLWCSPPRLIYMTLRDTCQHNSPWLTSRHNHTEFLTEFDWSSVVRDKAKMFVSGRFSSGHPSLKTEASHPDWKYLLFSNHLAGARACWEIRLSKITQPLALRKYQKYIYYKFRKTVVVIRKCWF